MTLSAASAVTEHFEDAEALINLAHNKDCTPEEQMLNLCEAQVHATLALVAAIKGDGHG